MTSSVVSQYDERSRKAKRNREWRKAPGTSAAQFDAAMGAVTLDFLDKWVPNHASVIDLGCGQAGVFPKLMKLGVTSYLGVDASQRALEEARRRISAILDHPPRRIRNLKSPGPVHATVAQLNLLTQILTVPETKRVDVVLCFNVMHYLNVKQTFTQARGVLRAGGYFLVIDLDGDKLVERPSRVWPFQSATCIREVCEYSDFPTTTFDWNTRFWKCTLPEWFHITCTSATEYRLSMKGLVDNVTEKYIFERELLTAAAATGFSPVFSRSVWSSLPSSFEMLGHAEERLLELYRLHVYQRTTTTTTDS